jgi:hypothetical protein
MKVGRGTPPHRPCSFSRPDREGEGSEPGVVVHTSNTSTQEAEVGGWRVQGQPRLHREILSQKRKGLTPSDSFIGLELSKRQRVGDASPIRLGTSPDAGGMPPPLLA